MGSWPVQVPPSRVTILAASRGAENASKTLTPLETAAIRHGSKHEAQPVQLDYWLILQQRLPHMICILLFGELRPLPFMYGTCSIGPTQSQRLPICMEARRLEHIILTTHGGLVHNPGVEQG